MPEPDRQPFERDPEQAYEQHWQGEEGDDTKPCRKAEGEGGEERRRDEVGEQGATGAGAGGDAPGAH